MTFDTASRVQRILVVDDNRANLQVAEGHLVAAGYAVTLAESGMQGLALAQSHPPDLVLLDILMPGIDGLTTCRRLKELPLTRDIPVVFLTALSDLGSHQRALESGADDFLTKPINRTELLIRVRSLLWMKRLRDELSQGYDLIRSQRDALLRAQRQKEELAALVVHDLKNPLAAILANVQYLVGAQHLLGEDREALLDVFSSAQSMHRMVMNLLDISRSEDGSLVPRLIDIDCKQLVEDACNTVRRRSDERRIRITHDVTTPTVQADGDLIRRLLENLLDNGIKYTPAGSTIHVMVHTVNERFMELRVLDEGLGIAPEHREAIFEKYIRLDENPEHNSSRGLGLAFCRLAAEAHGGRIWVEPNPLRGSAFCVQLPLSALSLVPAVTS
jgi:signal transduction histidine kinase